LNTLQGNIHFDAAITEYVYYGMPFQKLLFVIWKIILKLLKRLDG